MRVVLLGVLAFAFLVSCTGGDGGSSSPSPAPPKSCVDQWVAAKAVLVANCTNCHDGSKHPALLPEATFDASPVRAQVDGGKMPPAPASLSASDKAVLDAYLTCSGK